MTKKRVAGSVKKPCPKKGGVVANRVAKKPKNAKVPDQTKAVLIRKNGKKKSCRAPRGLWAVRTPRLDKLGSRKRKRDADKALRHKQLLADSQPWSLRIDDDIYFDYLDGLEE